MKLDKFVLALLCTVLMAYFFPEWGAANSILPLGIITTIGVSFIFFFYGVKLSPQKIALGLKNWKLHVLVQLSTFLLFPLIVLLAFPLIKTEDQHNIWLAVLFLAALPSTVSSSVVMVSIAKGNIPAAIFNASLSGIIGIFITPLWMGLFMQHQGNFDVAGIYVKLLIEIVGPIVLGVLLQQKLHQWALKTNAQLATFDKFVICLIVFKSFSESFYSGIFDGISWLHLGVITTICILLFYVVYSLIYTICRILGFSRADKITALFCGSKKSMVHGSVFAKVLFANNPAAGVMLLPLMIFHAFQLFIVSIYANKMGGMPEAN